MLKKLIEPLQIALMQRKICPGCMRDLDKELTRRVNSNQTEQVYCTCGRVFVFDRQLEVYRRAVESELI